MRSGGRGWRMVLFPGVVVFLAAVGCSGGSSATPLRVAMDADALTCEGTAVKTIDVPLDEGEFTIPALEIRKGMRCTLLFHVFNDGDSAVVLDTATVAGVGPAAGAGVRAVELSPVGAKPRQEDEFRGTQAIFSMDSQRLEAGDDEEFGVALEYHRGCTSPKDNISFSNSPAVKTEDGDEATASGPAYAFVGTDDSSCDE